MTNPGAPRFEDFMNKPPRALKDYYHHVKNPTSILSIQKAVTGVHGRKDPTHVSEYKSWASFEEAVGLLWENAYFYNTEDSEIYKIAEQLEVGGSLELANWTPLR